MEQKVSITISVLKWLETLAGRQTLASVQDKSKLFPISICHRQREKLEGASHL